MTSRSDKVKARAALTQETEAAIVKLNYWPKGWVIRVQFTRRNVGYSFRPRNTATIYRRKKGPSATVLILRLREDWLECVFKPGLAECHGRFLLRARPAILPPGAAACWVILALELHAGRPTTSPYSCHVEYGGESCLCLTPSYGMEELLRRALVRLGCEKDDVPF